MGCSHAWKWKEHPGKIQERKVLSKDGLRLVTFPKKLQQKIQQLKNNLTTWAIGRIWGISLNFFRKFWEIQGQNHNLMSVTFNSSDGTALKTILWQTIVNKHCSVLHLQLNLRLYCAQRKLYVNDVQKRRRFLWARAHLKWTDAWWKCVLTSQPFRLFVEIMTLCSPRQRRKVQARVCHGLVVH